MESQISFEQYQNLLRKYAWRTAKSWNVSYEDVVAEAYLVFVEAVEKFDNSRGIKFSTYLTHRLQLLTSDGVHGIVRKTKKWKKSTTSIDAFESHQVQYSFQRVLEFKDLIERELNEDSKVLLKYILENGQRVFLNDIQQYFEETLNWAQVRTQRAWYQIRSTWRKFDSAPISAN